MTSQAQLVALAMALKPTWLALHGELLKEPVIGVDQTGWPNLEERSAKKWQMWCIVAPKLVFHRKCDDKSATTFRELLGEYVGTVSDLASTNLAGAREGPMKLAGCWAHIYRKLEEAAANHPEAATMLGLIGELYAVDRRAASPSTPHGTSPRRSRSRYGLRRRAARRAVRPRRGRVMRGHAIRGL